MGRRAVMEECAKFRPAPGFDPRTVQPVSDLLVVKYIGTTIKAQNSRGLLFLSVSNSQNIHE